MFAWNLFIAVFLDDDAVSFLRLESSLKFRGGGYSLEGRGIYRGESALEFLSAFLRPALP